MVDDFDPYAILQVRPTADEDVIQAAYRALARRYHPDRSSAEAAGARMVELNDAWEVLGDPLRRAAYDQARAAGRLASPASPARGRGASADRPGFGHRPPAGQPATSGWRVGPHGEGAAGPPPGSPSGSVLDFGRHIGWSLGEIARVDPGYLEWLDRTSGGASYRDEIDRVLRRIGRRGEESGGAAGAPRRGRFGFSPSQR